MSKTQGWEYGQRSLEKSKSKIRCLLNEWDYEVDGEVTKGKISKKIKMGISTVNRHWSSFKMRILEINNNKK